MFLLNPSIQIEILLLYLIIENKIYNLHVSILMLKLRHKIIIAKNSSNIKDNSKKLVTIIIEIIKILILGTVFKNSSLF